MKEKHIEGNEAKENCYQRLEEFAREKIREHLHDLLEQEVTEWLGRPRERAQAQFYRTAGVSQRARQAAAVYDRALGRWR